MNAAHIRSIKCDLSKQPLTHRQFMPFISYREHSPYPRMDTSRRTLIVFDWDDTLLCSSHLETAGLNLASTANEVHSMKRDLETMADAVIKVLRCALEYGPVTLITNAEAGWIELSAEKFIPRVCPYLKKLTLYSARSKFEAMCPDAPFKWKYHAFLQCIHDANCLTWVRSVNTSMKQCVPITHSTTLENTQNLDVPLHTHHIARYTHDTVANVTPQSPTHVLSFGDSDVERSAAQTCTSEMKHHLTKAVKLLEAPTLQQLCQQLELIVTCFPQIYSLQHDLDLQLCCDNNVHENMQLC
jgi:hypothetical protein